MDKRHRLFFSLIICILLFALGCKHTDISREVTGNLILLDSLNVPVPDPDIESKIAVYRASLEEEMNQVLAISPFAMRKASPEGVLNNFVADLVFNIAQELYQPEDGKPIDFGLLNYGGLRTNLPEGEITRSRVFELMPFENEMVVLTLTGEKTQELFDYLAASERGMPVSGIRLGIKNKKIGTVLIQDQEFDPDKNYKVVTSDYLAEGGDRMRFFRDPVNYEVIGMRVRDAIILHMERETAKGNTLFSSLDGRIYIIE